MTFFSWDTHKTEHGYEAIVSRVVPRNTRNSDGKYADTTVIRRDVLSTRARAKGHAQRWVRYLKSQERLAA